MTALFDDLADTTEAMSRLLRLIAVEVGQAAPSPAEASPADTALARALAIHPTMGRRQRELIPMVERTGKRGADTGELSRKMGYDQPNVYLTLKNLAQRGFIRKDADSDPHRYFIGPALAQEAEQDGS